MTPNTAQRHRGSSPASTGYIPPFPAEFLPTPDCNLLPLSTTSESAQYLLKEPSALVELVNSVRVDLLQTSMLVNYISDYLKTGSKDNSHAWYILYLKLFIFLRAPFKTGVFYRVYRNWLNQCWSIICHFSLRK